MKKMNNKGQGAMEYLMTYGWAILVVMIVGVVLWQLGVFGGAGGNVNRATGFTVIKPFDRSIQATATSLNATFTNAGGTPISIGAMGISGATCTASMLGGVDTTTLDLTASPPVVLPVAGGDTVKFDCATTLTKGNSFAVSMNFTYTESVAGTTLTRTDAGRLTGTVE
jgi:hypothetical protein